MKYSSFSIKFSSQTFLLIQIGHFEDANRLLTDLQAELMSTENDMLSSNRSELLWFIERRLSQMELGLARDNEVSSWSRPIGLLYPTSETSDSERTEANQKET